MATSKFFSIAYRNLVRNGRKTALTALAVALGLVVVMAMSSLIEGMISTMLADSIRMTSGHLQIREESYDADKASLLSGDLLEDGAAWAAQAETSPEVESAAPVLWSGGLLSTPQESVGVQIVGIDTEDAFHDPIRQGVVAGEFLQNDNRGQILVGKILADQMEITVGRRVSVAASDANGAGQEGVFLVAGLIDTGFPSIDQNRIIMPLAQAQSFSRVGDRFSSLILMLHDQEEAATVAATFAGPETRVLTWQEMNALILQSVENGLIFYYVLYGIVFLAVAVLIANTLLRFFPRPGNRHPGRSGDESPPDYAAVPHRRNLAGLAGDRRWAGAGPGRRGLHDLRRLLFPGGDGFHGRGFRHGHDDKRWVRS